MKAGTAAAALGVSRVVQAQRPAPLGLDFGVARIPAVAGKPAVPFVGVKGVFVSRATRQREVAVEFVENHMLS